MVISLNSNNSSQEQDRHFCQETFFVQNYMLKTCSDFFFYFGKKKANSSGMFADQLVFSVSISFKVTYIFR